MASISVEQGVKLWFARTRKSLCPAWAEHVERLTRLWVLNFGGKEMKDLTPADMERYEMLRDDGERSGSALNQERTYLRGFFKWGKAMGHMGADPTSEWKSRKTDVKREYAPPTAEEEAKLLAHASPWMRRYILVSLYTGMRQGSIRQLTWEMVRDGVLHVPGRIVKQKSALKFPLVPKIKEGLGEPGTGLIFPGLPSSPSLYQYFQRLTEKAGVNPLMSPHDLRRGWVERLSNQNVALQTIMSLGGWKTMGVLLKHYCGPVSLDKATEVLSRI